MYLSRRDELSFAELPGRRSADPLDRLEETGAAGVSVRVVHLRHDPSHSRRPHRHPQSSEVVHVLAGTGMAWQDGTYVRVARGDTFLVARGVPHATLPHPGSSLELVCFFPHPDLGANTEELDGPQLKLG